MKTATAQFQWLLGLVGLSTLLLMSVTWPLWWDLPSPLAPRIPWVSGLTFVAGVNDRCAVVVALSGAGLMVISGCLLSLGRQRLARLATRAGIVAAFLGMTLSVLLDQHRLQPWVIQFLLFLTLALMADGSRFLRSWKWIICSIYFWSAISKFDFAFLTHQGPMFLQGMLRPLGIDPATWSPQRQELLSWMFPGGEMLAAVLLFFRMTRWVGLPFSLVMHLMLLWTVGVGLKHEWGVLIWNAFFIAQNIIVFGPDARWWKTPVDDVPASQVWRRPVLVFTLLIAVYPALELVGRCDHWPAWGVYSSRPAQVRVLIDESAAEQLPPELKRFLGQPAPLQDQVPFSLDGWCFANRHCPIYPQERYRLALALALLKQHLPAKSWLVEIRATPDRWTGERTHTRLTGTATIEHACQKFLINTRAR